MDRRRQDVAVDFTVEDEVHQFLLDGVVAAVDFVDEQEDRLALGDFFVNFAEFMVDGVNRRARFDRRQAADFPFF